MSNGKCNIDAPVTVFFCIFFAFFPFVFKIQICVMLLAQSNLVPVELAWNFIEHSCRRLNWLSTKPLKKLSIKFKMFDVNELPKITMKKKYHSNTANSFYAQKIWNLFQWSIKFLQYRWLCSNFMKIFRLIQKARFFLD